MIRVVASAVLLAVAVALVVAGVAVMVGSGLALVVAGFGVALWAWLVLGEVTDESETDESA